MSTMEVYTPDEIIHVIELLEAVQDVIGIENNMFDEQWDMIQEAIDILYNVEDEE